MLRLVFQGLRGDKVAGRAYVQGMRWVFALFVVVPLVELYLLVWLSQIIGFWTTVAITLVTGIVGGSLAKREGLRVWRAWNEALEQMRPPEQGVIDGVLVLVGGALLVTPGVLTDLAGFFALLPPTRRLIARTLRRGIDTRMRDGRLQVISMRSGYPGPRSSTWSAPGDVVETRGESLPNDS